MPARRWSDLTPLQRVWGVLVALVQTALVVTAERDISRRPQAEVRGPKWVWRIVAMVNFVGPITYFVAGRKR